MVIAEREHDCVLVFGGIIVRERVESTDREREGQRERERESVCVCGVWRGKGGGRY